MKYENTLLIATPSLNCPTFGQSLVYVYEDTQKGTVGLVLNKPSTFAVSKMAQINGLEYIGAEMVYKGGPVNDQAIIMLHTDDWYCSNTLQVGNGLAITSDKMMLDKLVMGNKPKQWRVFAGVAAWQPGQLEHEIKVKKSWLTARVNRDIIFDLEGTRQWHAGIELCGSQVFSNYL